jgi:diguanylate cyclase (GGDEF)-like protein
MLAKGPEGQRIPIDSDGLYPGLPGVGFRERRAFFTNYPGDHPTIKPIKTLPKELKNMLVVPIFDQDQPAGLVLLANTRMGYNAADLKRVEQLTELYALTLQRERMRAQLEAYQLRLQGLQETMAEGIALCEVQRDENAEPVDYTFIEINPAFEAISGLGRKGVLGKNSRQVFRLAKALELETILEAVRSGRKRSIESELPGTDKSVQLSAYGTGGDRFTLLLDDISQRRIAQARLEFLDTHDVLTDLPRRELLFHRLEHALKLAHRSKTRVAVALVDVDSFKKINDTYGHANGDLVLKAVANRLRQVTRESDTVARIGGDEFMLILEHVKTTSDAQTAAKKILNNMKEPIEIGEWSAQLSVSIGLSLFPDDGKKVKTLLKNADIAMYRVKQHGRNGFQFYGSN